IYYRGTVLTDTWGPCVTGSIPWDGQTDVSIFEPFTLNFSEPMYNDSVENAFSWTDGTTTWNADNCSGIDWNPYGDEVKFMPEIPLKYLVAEYSMTIDTTATDLAGNPLTSSYTISFTTSDDIDPPFIDHVLSMNEVNYDKEYVIWANITDQWGTVNSARVDYQGVHGDDRSEPMTHINGTLYTATIPAQMALGNVSYSINTTDAFNNFARLPDNTSNNFTYRVVDGTPPGIAHLQQTEWPVNQQIDIWAVVLDEIELVSVELQYKGVSDVAFSSVPMQSNGSTNTYNCTMQAQYDIGYFQYSIEAVDGSDNVNTTVVYSMLITDLTKPEIIFVKTEHIANQTKVLIQANVTDDVELDEVTLYFRAVGGNRWVERPMQNVGGSLFEYTIPAQRNSGTIYYYVNATDTAGNVASTLEADQYYEIDVIGVGTDWTPYIILSVILIILVVVLIHQLSKRFGKGSEPGQEMPTDDEFQTDEIGEPPEQLDEPQVDIEPESPEAEPEEPRVDA
ncbi:MAG: Ig-like domain-containing protein, partial [Thermoplasmata archaeon]|nr:Ig-like domain-containing protein [Thermoplasmata archaeon]